MLCLLTISVSDESSSSEIIKVHFQNVRQIMVYLILRDVLGKYTCNYILLPSYILQDKFFI